MGSIAPPAAASRFEIRCHAGEVAGRLVQAVRCDGLRIDVDPAARASVNPDQSAGEPKARNRWRGPRSPRGRNDVAITGRCGRETSPDRRPSAGPRLG